MTYYLKRKIRTIFLVFIFFTNKKNHLASRQICKIFYQKSGQKTPLINFQSRKKSIGTEDAKQAISVLCKSTFLRYGIEFTRQEALLDGAICMLLASKSISITYKKHCF